MSAINSITFWIFVGVWPLWGVWELVLLWLRRRQGAKPGTISMVAKDRAWHLNALPYLWGGLATHYWWPGGKWAGTAGGVAFWAIAVALLVQDIILWNRPVDTWPKWLRYQRWPLLWLVVGAAAGKLLFPQAGMVP